MVFLNLFDMNLIYYIIYYILYNMSYLLVMVRYFDFHAIAYPSTKSVLEIMLLPAIVPY